MQSNVEQRAKLLNAMLFFVKNTRNCHKTKLFKLLFLLDFSHFRETGRSVTGLSYAAWPKGPVPPKLYEELEDPSTAREDMKALLALRVTSELEQDFPTKRLLIQARKSFDRALFTLRELDAMERLADIYKSATALEMVEVTHLPNKPWHQVYEVEHRHQAPIPYVLALDEMPGSISSEHAELIEAEAREAAALLE